MRRVSFLLLVFVFLFMLVSCEVEMQEIPPAYFLRTVQATVWKETVATESDTEDKDISVSDLENGTAPARLVKLTTTVDPSEFVGYQILYCEFTLTASTDANLTLEPIVRSGASNEAQRQGRTDYKLTGETATEISLPIEINISTGSEAIVFEIAFTSTLPFSDGTEEEPAHTDLASWAAIAYEISGLRFYGAQTTAN